MNYRDKKCVVCNHTYKPTTGKQFTCNKQCSRQLKSTRQRLWRKNNPDKVKDIEKRVWRKQSYQKYRKSENYRRLRKIRYKKNIAKKRAEYFLNNAVRDGLIDRQNFCMKCGREDWGTIRTMIEAHHMMGYSPDYWLQVEWLCVPCHKLADKEDNENSR